MANLGKKGKVYYIREKYREGNKWKEHWTKIGPVPFDIAKAAKLRYETDKIYLRLEMVAPYKGTLKDLFTEYHQHATAAKLKKANTLTFEKVKLDSLAKRFGDVLICKLDPKQVELFFAEKNYKPNTVILFIKALKRAYEYAIEKNYIKPSQNPATKIKKPKQVLMPPKACLHEDILKVFGHLAPDKRAPFEFMYYAGLRPSEAFRLQVKNIDKGCIDLYPDQTKTAERGIIPLHPNLVPIAEMLIKAAKKSKTIYLFPFNNTHQLEMKRPWAQACRKAKLHITPYQLRHSFATRLLEKTGDIRTVQQLMRHTDIKMTTRYATAVDAKLHDAIKNF